MHNSDVMLHLCITTIQFQQYKRKNKETREKLSDLEQIDVIVAVIGANYLCCTLVSRQRLIESRYVINQRLQLVWKNNNNESYTAFALYVGDIDEMFSAVGMCRTSQPRHEFQRTSINRCDSTNSKFEINEYTCEAYVWYCSAASYCARFLHIRPSRRQTGAHSTDPFRVHFQSETEVREIEKTYFELPAPTTVSSALSELRYNASAWSILPNLRYFRRDTCCVKTKKIKQIQKHWLAFDIAELGLQFCQSQRCRLLSSLSITKRDDFSETMNEKKIVTRSISIAAL